MLIEAISTRTKVPVASLRKIAASASRRYFEFTIQKRDGTERLIAHPSRPLKALQRWIARNVVGLAPVHPAATAYAKGSKISRNAELHAATKFTTRLDFREFFPSFDSVSVGEFFRKISADNSLNFSDDDINFATKIVCRSGRLAIGAPSSPKITNAMMFEFDTLVAGEAANLNAVYTRYADDIFLSGFDFLIVRQLEEKIRKIVDDQKAPKLVLKEEKTLHLSRAQHRSVTGLVITPDGAVSIGRARKREIKTLVHLGLHDKLKAGDRARLAGLIAFVSDVEPLFLIALSRKFSVDVRQWAKSL